MSKNIRPGGDPRNYLEFTEIRHEINKLNDPAATKIDFAQIEVLTQALFAKNGVDLQTAAYLTLAKTKLDSLNGFSEGCTLIAELVNQHWQQFWPENETARINLFDWLNNYVGKEVRAYPFTIKNIALLIQIEQPLKAIATKLQAEHLKKTPKIVELFDYIKNTRATLEKRFIDLQPAKKSTLLKSPKKEVIVYTPPADITKSTADELTQTHYTLTPTIAKKAPRFKGWHGFIAGSLITGAILFGINHFYQKPSLKPEQGDLSLFTPLSETNITFLVQSYHSKGLVNTDNANSEDLQQQLKQLQTLSPLANRYYGDNLAHIAQRLWPDTEQSNSIVNEWENGIALQRQTRFMRDSYANARQQVQKLADELNGAEQQKRSITISQLKSAVYGIQSQLDRDVPLEELLRQLSEQERTSPALIKKIDERFNSLLSYYYALQKENR
jgi:type VI secretion system protein VasL